MPSLHRVLPVVALAGVLPLSACSNDSTPAANQTIQVTSSDTACQLTRTSASTGTIAFTVNNTGTKVTEFYLYGEGNRVVGEVENITPGVTRTLTVEITQPGTYTTACKPGMAGEGIRAPFTVTG